jgi:hypothetical protein
MIVVALLLFVVHYMCQMRLGWRQQGNDVGVLFNLLFYSPSAILLSWSQLNILRAGHRRWSFMRYGVVGYALMVLCIVAGVISNGSLHIGPMLYVADVVAGYFGGGGHAYAAGFRAYEDYDVIVRELVDATDKALKEYHDTQTPQHTD